LSFGRHEASSNTLALNASMAFIGSISLKCSLSAGLPISISQTDTTDA
jgi:hypothetical protein